MVRSRRCRTILNFRKLEQGSAVILRTRRRETSEGKYEGRARFARLERFTPNLIEKKFSLSRTPQEIHHASTGFPHAVAPSALWRCRHVNLTRLVRQLTLKSSMHRCICMLLVAVASIAGAAPASAESVTLFRVFLNDGTAIVSYGEYARVGDRVVFSMPIGAVDEACRRSQPSRRQSACVGDQLDRDREVRRVRAAHALHGQQRRVRLRDAGRRRRRDAERHCAGQRREGAAVSGGRCAPAPRDVAARSLRIPGRRRRGDARTAGRSDLGAAARCRGDELRHRPCRDGAAPRSARSGADAESSIGGRGHHAGDCRGEGHRHRRRSCVDSSRRHRRARQST